MTKEFTGYVPKTMSLEEALEYMAFEENHINMNLVYGNEGQEFEFEEGDYPPRKVKVTVKVEEINESANI